MDHSSENSQPVKPRYGHPLSEEEKQRLADLARAGVSVRTIAAELKCSDATVYVWLGTMGITAPGKASRIGPEEEVKICEMKRSGMTVYEICDATGRKHHQIHLILKKHEIPVPHPHTKLTGDMRSDIVALFRDGKTMKELAAQFGVHEQTVRGTLAQAGIIVRAAKDKRKRPQRFCACGAGPLGRYMKRCKECLAKYKFERVRKYNRRRLENGRCQDCNGELNTEWTRCRRCLKERSRKLENLKRTCIDGYGGKCTCCGECFSIDFLVIDHVDNDGSEQRAKGHKCGAAMYRRIIKEGFPKNLQVLCWNCNWSKRLRGQCIHKITSEEEAKKNRQDLCNPGDT